MEENSKYEKFIYIIIGFIIGFFVITFIYSSQEEELKDTISSQNETIAQLQEEIKEKNGKIEDLSSTIENKDDDISNLKEILNNEDDESDEEVAIDLREDYILNTNTKKFHYPYCSSVDKMKESNKKEFRGDRDEVIDMGYSPCQRCNP